MSFRSVGVPYTRRLMQSQSRIALCGQGWHHLATPNKLLTPGSAIPNRYFSDAAAATSTEPKESTGSKEKKKKKDDNSNIFLDNLGKIFLGAIGLLIASLVRSSYGTSNKTKVREELEEQAALDPLEVDDLRVANSELTPEVFRTIMADVQETFPEDTATYQDFVSCVRKTMARLKGDAFTVELGYLVDRAVLAALREKGKREDEPVSLLFLLTALSMSLCSSVDDRITILFEAMHPKDGTVKFKDIQAMVGCLQDTCQLVPDAQIVKGGRQYPTQQYERGTPDQLVQWEGSDQDDLDREAFSAVITSKAVCAWGECYNRRRKKQP